MTVKYSSQPLSYQMCNDSILCHEAAELHHEDVVYWLTGFFDGGADGLGAGAAGVAGAVGTATNLWRIATRAI